jgi:hypothetical protein
MQLTSNRLDLSYFDRFCKVVLMMDALTHLCAVDNELVEHDNYKMRILENQGTCADKITTIPKSSCSYTTILIVAGIQVLDHQAIKPALRKHLFLMKQKKDLDQVVEETTHEYMAKVCAWDRSHWESRIVY